MSEYPAGEPDICYFHCDHLIDLLQLGSSRIITLTGAGGKTTLMNLLAEAFCSRGLRTLITTTTHIMKPSDFEHIRFVEKESSIELQEAFSKSLLVGLGIPCSRPPVKWSSPSLDFLDTISHIPDVILCEGDGSRSMPVKLPRRNEPVFYPGSDTVIGLVGLSCLGKPAGKVLFGLHDRQSTSIPRIPKRITPDFLVTLADSSWGLKKNISDESFVLVLNQADRVTQSMKSHLLKCAKIIKDNGTACHIVSLKDQYVIL